jgi:hypothetical protein
MDREQFRAAAHAAIDDSKFCVAVPAGELAMDLWEQHRTMV